MENIKSLLQEYGIRPNKRLDQHFLVSRKYIETEIEAAGITKNDAVLEIGPGIGTLTEELLKRAKKVIAVELDKNLASILKERFPGNNFSLIEGDALKVKIPHFDICVSNIPYSISSKVAVLLGKLAKPAVLMFQKEFADRLVSKPGEKNYSRISVAAQYYFTAQRICTVPKSAYYPEPEVDSAIVKLSPREKKPYVGDEDFFFRIVSDLFTHKNQAARNALIHSRRELGLGKKDAQRIFSLAPYAGEKGRNLTIEKIAEMSLWIRSALS